MNDFQLHTYIKLMAHCKMYPLLNNKDDKMNVLNRTVMDQAVDSTVSDVREITYRTKGQYNGFATRLFSPSDLGHEVKPFISSTSLKLNRTADISMQAGIRTQGFQL